MKKLIAMEVALNKQNYRIYGACLEVPTFIGFMIYKQSIDIKTHYLS